jgi:hypothetical protein
MIGGGVVVEPPSAVGIAVLLMSMKSQVLKVIFRTPGRVDVEPPSVADSLRECTTTSPRAWQAAVDAVVDDVEDEVVEVYFFSELSVAIRRVVKYTRSILCLGLIVLSIAFT